MKSRSEGSTVGGQRKMEGVNMPASFRFASRWMVGATVAAMFGLLALPGVGHATNIEICINSNGLIRGVNLGVDGCNGLTEIDWTTVGPSGPTGATGVLGNPGPQGPPGVEGIAGLPGPAGGQGDAGPQGPQGAIGPTGPTGPQGEMGKVGVTGPTGETGAAGVTGPSGTPESNISVLTGGSLGSFGASQSVNLTGLTTTLGGLLILGPGNGADTSAPPAFSTNPEAVEVPMSEAGTAKRLFVAVDNDPGSQPGGAPEVFTFFLCNGNTFPANCGLTCMIVGPDTTCNDLTETQGYVVGDLMSVVAFSTDIFANNADVKWSVTYDRGIGSPIIPIP